MVVYYNRCHGKFVTDYIISDVKPYRFDTSWWIVPGTINLEK